MPDYTNITLTATGDKELWVVRGVEFELPVFATHLKDEAGAGFVLVQHAMAYHGSVYGGLSAMMEQLTVDHSGQWIIPAERFSEIASKAQGVTPEYYVRIGSLRPYKPEPVKARSDQLKEGDGPDYRAFAQFVSNECQIHSPGAVMLFLSQVRDCAVKWMLDHHRPLDLGFARIYAVPYRANWKEFWDSWFPAGIFRNSPVDREPLLREYEFDRRIVDPVLFDMLSQPAGPRRSIVWNLEIVPSTEWRRRVEFREMKSLKDRGTYYVERVREIITKMRPLLLEIYTKWLRRSNVPGGKVCESRMAGGMALCADTAVAVRHPNRRARGMVRPDQFSAQAARPLENFSGPFGSLPALSIVQSPAGDMRYTRRDMVEQ